jgi:hypothetical protein
LIAAPSRLAVLRRQQHLDAVRLSLEFPFRRHYDVGRVRAWKIPLTRLISVAIAGKLSILRTDESFRERAALGDVAPAQRTLQRAGRVIAPLRAMNRIKTIGR